MKKSEELKDPNSCMSRAKDDEMTFVLLGRDAAAPVAIRAWINERLRLGKNVLEDGQIQSAILDAQQMDGNKDWYAEDPPADHLAEVDRLTKELKDPWMHIALAPKTGEHILVADRNGFGWGVCGGKRQWPTAVVHWWDHPGEQGWYLSLGGDQEFPNPTHFQLIEAPPRDVEYPCGCSASAGSPSYCPIHGESDLSIGDVHRSEVQEIKTKLVAAEQRISELTSANEGLQERNAEVNMLAFQWMLAHDSLAGKKPYEFPTVVDVPKSLERVKELTARLERMQKALKKLVDETERCDQPGMWGVSVDDDVFVEAREALEVKP